MYIFSETQVCLRPLWRCPPERYSECGSSKYKVTGRGTLSLLSPVIPRTVTLLLELSTNLREVLKCPEKVLNPMPTRAFTIRNLLRQCAKQTFKHGKQKQTWNWDTKIITNGPLSGSLVFYLMCKCPLSIVSFLIVKELEGAFSRPCENFSKVR